MEKTDEKEIEIIDVPALPQVQPVHDKLIELALSENVGLEKLEKLMDLKERNEKNEAKKAYHVAVTNFKKEAPKVSKDKENKQYKSWYTSLENLVNTVNPVLSKHGLTIQWDTVQGETIKVSCIMTHVLGHSETTSMEAPPDTSGSKNTIQQIKSTITYLKGVTYESITGIASDCSNLSDDGNSSGEKPLKLDFKEAIEKKLGHTPSKDEMMVVEEALGEMANNSTSNSTGLELKACETQDRFDSFWKECLKLKSELKGE